MFGLRCAQKTKPCFVTELFLGRLPAVYPASRVALIALRSFLDKSGKGKKERGKRKEERGKRKEERGKRKLKKVLIVTN